MTLATRTTLADIVDEDLLAEMIAQRYVKRGKHPVEDLYILNYTQACQFDKAWNEATLACRGIVVDSSGTLRARPFRKFFNLAEHPVEDLPSGPVHVTEKMDGSLGILYPVGNGHAIATRGSFASEQAAHATRLWQERYAPSFQPNPDWTYLFEVVYPENRIVVDYHGMDDLVLLGANDIATGSSIPLDQARTGWPGPVVPEHPYASLTEALGAPARTNCEGMVVHFTDADLRVKVKYDEYVRLHRIVTGVSTRRIWEALSEGLDIQQWLEAVPDECFDFVTQARAQLTQEHERLTQEVEDRYVEVLSCLPEGWQRKDFALQVQGINWPLARALYLRLDERPYSHLVWQHLRPAEHVPIWGQSPDAD